MDCSRARTRAPVEWIDTCPEFLQAALKRKKPAAAGFDEMAIMDQRESISWLANAKRPETRKKRLKEASAALAHGLKWVDRKKAFQ